MEKGIHIFKRDGSNWVLEQLIPQAETEDMLGITFRTRNILLAGKTLVIYAEDLFDDHWGRIQIFRHDGSEWSLEKTVSNEEPVDGLDIKKPFAQQSNRFVELAGLSDNHLVIVVKYLDTYGRSFTVIYVLGRDGSEWVLEKKDFE